MATPIGYDGFVMARRNVEKRELLFGVLAANLTALLPEASDIVVCPLCHSVHGRDSLLGNDPAMTLEHCIPESLGGSILTLTCKACNNNCGSSHDSHLRNLLTVEDAVKGIGTLEGTTSINGHSYRCEVGFGRDGERALNLMPVMKASNPKERHAAFAVLRAAGEAGLDLEIKVRLRFGYSQVGWRTALVKAAYLLMFRQFGYSYVFADGPEFVRRLLLQPNYEVLAAACALKPQLGETPIVNRVLIVESPNELRCFVMPVEVRTDHRKQVKFVILPGFDDEPIAIYERWNKAGKHGPISDVKLTTFDAGLQSLTHPHQCGALALWDQAFGRWPRLIRLTRSDANASPPNPGGLKA